MLMSAQQADYGQTPSQTVGPYFAYGLTATQYGYDFDQPFDAVVALDNATGERIRLEGRVIDGCHKKFTTGGHTRAVTSVIRPRRSYYQ